jgi:hypothetical protein
MSIVSSSCPSSLLHVHRLFFMSIVFCIISIIFCINNNSDLAFVPAPDLFSVNADRLCSASRFSGFALASRLDVFQRFRAGVLPDSWSS